MIKLLGSVPKKVYIALSGGADSMAALDFLSRGNRDIIALYFNHGTEFSHKAESFVKGYCKKKNIPLKIGQISRAKLDCESTEEYWRNERYRFFFRFNDRKIITCHHLDDSVETWIFTSLHGNPNLIPYSRDNFIRPFLVTKKKELLDWCIRNNTPYLDDPSNLDTSYMRNFIRHELMKDVLKVNPGIQKVIRKKIIHSYNNFIDN